MPITVAEWTQLLALMRRTREEVAKWPDWKKGPEYVESERLLKETRRGK